MQRERRTVWTCGYCGQGHTSLAWMQGHEAECEKRQAQAEHRKARWKWGWAEQRLVEVTK